MIVEGHTLLMFLIFRLHDIMKRYPLIDSQCEEDSVKECPSSIYEPFDLNEQSMIVISALGCELLQEFCISSKQDNEDAWKLSNVQLEDCRHLMPRLVMKLLNVL